MHRRMPKKMVMTAAALIAVAGTFLMTGCTGESKGSGEELVELSDAGAEKVPEEEGNTETRETQSAEGTNADEVQEIPQKETDGPGSGAICVHVCGEVVSPGVYRLPSGSRIYEAIDAAGGLLESAADGRLNQAALIEDGQQIYVPSVEEAQQGAAGVQNAEVLGQPSADDGKVNLNTASREQLMTLSGIGEAKAAAIIAYREEHGGFQKAEDLMKVEGIKEGVFNKVRDQIKIE